MEKVILWELCNKQEYRHADKGYAEKPESFPENKIRKNSQGVRDSKELRNLAQKIRRCVNFQEEKNLASCQLCLPSEIVNWTEEIVKQEVDDDTHFVMCVGTFVTAPKTGKYDLGNGDQRKNKHPHSTDKISSNTSLDFTKTSFISKFCEKLVIMIIIIQEVENWPYEQIEFAQPRIRPRKWDTQKSLGVWGANGWLHFV